MCEFCTKHGDGEKWYLQAKNYSDDLLNDLSRRAFIKDVFYWINNAYRTKFGFLKSLPVNVPVIGGMFRMVVKRWFLQQHWGQVIPIDEVEKILAITNSITRVPCVCRMTTAGREQRVCFLISLDPTKIGISDMVDQSFFGGPDIAKFEKIDKKTALEFMKELENNGMIHTIWTLKTPFIGGLCNCDSSTGCISMKMYKEVMPIIFRAEYIALTDRDRCIGCKACLKVCQFNAIRFDNKSKKIEIDTKKCYGCGICRMACKKNAIYLKDRRTVPEAANLW